MGRIRGHLFILIQSAVLVFIVAFIDYVHKYYLTAGANIVVIVGRLYHVVACVVDKTVLAVIPDN